MIASLPMYDRPETCAANDLLWQHIKRHLNFPACPKALQRTQTPWQHWMSPDLLLSQTCGMPYREHLHGQTHLVGVWDHGLDCAAGLYYSVIVARVDDPRDYLRDFADAQLAYNDPMSQSGWAAPQNMALSDGWSFQRTIESGAHSNSARMVADGSADLAAIDVISWTMMIRWDRFTDRLRIVTRTPPTPALPLITAFPEHIDALQAATAKALDTLPQDARALLCIDGLRSVTTQDYLSIQSPALP